MRAIQALGRRPLLRHSRASTSNASNVTQRAPKLFETIRSNPAISQEEFINLAEYPWLSPQPLSPTFWQSADNIRRFFDWMGSKMGINSLDQWYDVTSKQCSLFGGIALTRARGSFLKNLRVAYPNHDWQEWRFPWSTKGVFEQKDVRKRFFDSAAKDLGFGSDLSGWYTVTPQQIRQLGGKTLVVNFKGREGLLKALREAYPDHEFLEWRVTPTLKAWWASPENQRTFMAWAQKQLNLSSLEDWYKVTPDQFNQIGGFPLFRRNDKSMAKVLQTTFPEHKWDWMAFPRVASDSFENLDLQREALESAGKQLGVTALEDWYKIQTSSFTKTKFRTVLIRRYNGSLAAALSALYPTHNWQKWRFSAAPRGFWRDKQNVRDFFECKARELGVQSLADWYRFSYTDIGSEEGVLSVVYGSWMRALMLAFPEHPWDMRLFKKVYSPSSGNTPTGEGRRG